MSNKINNDGYNLLARTLQGRFKRLSEIPPMLEFGTIQSDYSLLTNKFPIPIPQKDYFVCRQLTLGKKDDILTETQSTGKPNSGSHTHAFAMTAGPFPVEGEILASPDSKHVHDVLIPEKMRWLQPGDQVLVAWVDGDPVVIDIIFPASEVGK